MIFVKKYEKEEILKLIAEEAIKTLPNKQKGIVEAKYIKGGRGAIEVYFLPSDSDEQAS